MANTKPRVIIPAKPADLLGLAARVYAKHVALDANSPLKALQTHIWEVNGPQVANALTLHQQAEEYKRNAEEAYAKRDLLSVEITESLKATRDLLLGIYRDNPKELGQWGFEVDDSARAAKKKA
jgi:hypothetical protein